MWRRMGAIIRRHAYEAAGNPDRIADALLWPCLDVITWGFFSRYLVRGGDAAFAAPAQLVGGIILWGTFRAFQRDIAVGFLAEIWSRNIAGLFVSPLGVGEYLAGLVLLNLAKLAIVLGLIAGVCHALTGVPGDALILLLLPSLGILLCFGAAIGLFVTGLILRFSTRVQTLAYGLAGLLMPVSCVFYPLAALPPALRGFAGLLPTTQAFEALRAAMQGQSGPVGALADGGGGALLALAAAGWYFSAVWRAAHRGGQLVRPD
jgi:ABC-2 type transport system permease protein